MTRDDASINGCWTKEWGGGTSLSVQLWSGCFVHIWDRRLKQWGAKMPPKVLTNTAYYDTLRFDPLTCPDSTELQFDQLLRSLWDQAMASGSVFRYPLTGVSTRRVPGKYGFVVQVTVWPDSHNHEPAVITAVWLGFTLTKMVVSFYLQSNTKRNTHRRTPIVINAVKQPFDPSKFNFNKINKQEVLLIRIIVTWLYVYILCGFVTDQWLFTFIISIRGVLLF